MTQPTIAIFVMHVPGDPERNGTLWRLLDRADEASIVADPDRQGPWSTARRCWELGIASGVDWIVVLNDDALPCEAFAEVARAALAELPEGSPACFYTAHPRAAEVEPGTFYTTTDGLVGVACAMHRETARSFLAWHDEHKNDAPYPDDARINLFAAATGRLVYTTVPSLVDHQLPAASTVGNEGHAHRHPVVPPLASMRRLRWSRARTHDFGRQYRGNVWDLVVHTKERARTAALIESMYSAHRGGLGVDERHVQIVTPIFGEPAAIVERTDNSRRAVTDDLTSHGVDVSIRKTPGDSLVMRMRQREVHAFLKSTASHLLFWDADIEAMDPTCVREMLETGHDVIAGACPFKDLSGRVVCNLWPVDAARGTLRAEGGCIEVRDAGTGFMLISRRALVRLMSAHPEMMHVSLGASDRGEPLWALFDTAIVGGVLLSEDYFFCHLWQELGERVYVYAPARFRHWGYHAFEGDLEHCYRIENAEKAHEEARRQEGERENREAGSRQGRPRASAEAEPRPEDAPEAAGAGGG